MNNKIILNKEAETEILNSTKDLEIEEFEFDAKTADFIFFDSIDFPNNVQIIGVKVSLEDSGVNKDLYRNINYIPRV
jgi:hypothetical protein